MNPDPSNPLRPLPMSTQSHQTSFSSSGGHGPRPQAGAPPPRPERSRARGPRAQPILHQKQSGVDAENVVGLTESERLLKKANALVLSQADRQEGYDIKLLDLQPRGLQAHPPPPDIDNPLADGETLDSCTRASSFDVDGRLSSSGLSAGAGSGKEMGLYTYVSRSADGHESTDDIEKAGGRRSRGAGGGGGRRRQKRTPWWHRKLTWAAILIALVIVGAGVGLGIGLGLEKHRDTSTAPASGVSNRPTPNGAASDLTATVMTSSTNAAQDSPNTPMSSISVSSSSFAAAQPGKGTRTARGEATPAPTPLAPDFDAPDIAISLTTSV